MWKKLHRTFWILGGFTELSSAVFLWLKEDVGGDVSNPLGLQPEERKLRAVSRVWRGRIFRDRGLGLVGPMYTENGL